MTSVNETENQGVDEELIRTVSQTSAILLVSAVAIVGNCVNLRVIPRISDVQMSEASKVFYLALSVADLVTGLAIMVGKLSVLAVVLMHGSIDISCKISGFAITLGPGCSAIFIFLLNVDRFVYITSPLRYHLVITRRRSIYAVLLASIYVSAGVLGLPLIHDVTFGTYRMHDVLGLCKLAFSEPTFVPFTIAMFCLNMWLVAVALLVMYGKIIKITIEQTRKIRVITNHQHRRARAPPNSSSDALPGQSSCSPGSYPVTWMTSNKQGAAARSADQLRNNLRTFKTPLLVTSCYFLLWIPFSVLEVYIGISLNTELLNSCTYKVISALAASNCTMNLYVYCFSRKEYRSAVKHTLCGRLNRSTAHVRNS